MLVACYYTFILSKCIDHGYLSVSDQVNLWDLVRLNKDYKFFNVESEDGSVIKFYIILEDDDYKKNYISLRVHRKYRRFKFTFKKKLYKQVTSIKLCSEFQDDKRCSSYIGIYNPGYNNFRTMNMNMDLAENLIQYLDKSLWL